jgi:hypothetical protein
MLPATAACLRCSLLLTAWHQCCAASTRPPRVGVCARSLHAVLRHAVMCGAMRCNVCVHVCLCAGLLSVLQGVLYTHRSNYLHAIITTTPDMLALGAGAPL